MSGLSENNKFFDHAAEYYDLMIPFDKAVERKEKILETIISPGMKEAADLGCGTGTDSIALAKLGLNVSAFEPSAEMIKKAKINTEKLNVDIEFSISSIADIPRKMNRRFDLVISFGNTLANINKNSLQISLNRCSELLRIGGTLLIQVLNYHKILTEKNRIVNITEADGNLFIRFYDFEDDGIVFNILKINKTKLSDYSIISTRIYPHRKEDFEYLLSGLKFQSIEFHSGFDFNPFTELSSKDLVIKGIK